jgi:phage portal protein BeeE
VVLPVSRRGDYATQPWNRVLWPHETDPRMGGVLPGTPYVWDVESALKIPAVSRATALYSGLIRQCAMDAYRGTTPLPRPRLLDRPDPSRPRAWFVGVNVEDYLWHGNAVALVTDRNAEGWPSAVSWVPARWVYLSSDPGQPRRYYVGATEVPTDDVLHVRRGANRWDPDLGVGVVEQHLATFDRVALEEEYERSALTRAGVPSVAVIAPNPSLSQDEADDADARWAEKFAVRKPVFLPLGTQVVPLGWSPSDAQMVEARKASLTDVANAFNLDGYWLGSELKGLTYRSPGPLYLSLLRTSLEPVLADFEQAWSDAWLPRGQAVRFDRLQLTRDDFGASIDALAKATTPPQSAPDLGAILGMDEARLYLGLPPETGPTVTSPVDTEEVPEEVPQ